MIYHMGTNHIRSFSFADELYHHGILGQKWGVRRYQNPDGSSTKLGLERRRLGRNTSHKSLDFNAYKKNKSVIVEKNGNKTFPSGYMFNRVGQSNMDINASGGLYVSSGKDDAARYVKNLGPSLIGKLMNSYGTTIQHIKVDKPLSMPSDEKIQNMTIDYFQKNVKLQKLFDDNSISSYAMNLSSNEILGNKNPNTDEKKQYTYAIFSMFGDSDNSKEVKNFYQYCVKNGCDILPDYADRYSGTSSTASIIINPSKISLHSKTLITKEVYKSGKKYVKSLEDIPIDEAINKRFK